MSDQQTNQQQDDQPYFNIQRVYLKDMSLEQPNSPQIFLETEAPSVEVQVNVGASQLTDGIFEVVVTGTVTTKVQDKVAFLVEAHQAGIFDIRNVPDEQLDPLLGIACPTILYPYLRSNIADVITRAGFQAIHLSEINFQALYEQRLQAAMEQAQAEGGGAGIVMPDGTQARH
ncbi:protein-export chaperone SecB [Cupriavidus gilardii]|jgi:protein-export chaperone SecB|uniref:Protein-export protein SecB n=1 Tax=Cupriavidus cauae TaxID=2608999 RepID=A0A5M8AG87_9BURK|nr:MULTISPECIES: protein-export chaperone SecB [Cupriavidus]KAA0181418.1 protein-export chaperone SecB [Cupriavidus gilardii]KAA6122363.1 protein-export chaperone SecB [Cupriavidus cauae]MBO4119194.1 protein-export chaperone SecB [Cupriavidus gilardii]MCA7085155.1 protein-export chaperone SecB [Cupriavidus sp. DB3]MCG5262499.1 protein-export chaperone SecB [Cupriavidus gilardii]